MNEILYVRRVLRTALGGAERTGKRVRASSVLHFRVLVRLCEVAHCREERLQERGNVGLQGVGQCTARVRQWAYLVGIGIDVLEDDVVARDV